MSRLKHIYQAMDAIFEADLSHKAKMVYLNLCRRADAEGKSFPTITRIAKDMGFSTSSVERAIKELVSAGWITKQNRLRKGTKEYTSNVYTVHIPTVAVSENVGKPTITEKEPNTACPVTVKEEDNYTISSKKITLNYNNVVAIDSIPSQSNPNIERLRELLKQKSLKANTRTLQLWLTVADIETIVQIITYATNKQGVKNLIGYITTILQSGFVPVVSSAQLDSFSNRASERPANDKYSVFYDYYRKTHDEVVGV